MDFFADGGFQQLFCDLNDQQTFVMWDKPLNSNCTGVADSFISPYHTTQDIRQFQEENCLYFEHDSHLLGNDSERQHVTDINEKQLQISLDYLLNTSHDSMGDYDSISRLTPLPFLSPELSDREEKFLDNYIEIPELVDILTEKTPFCNHFLQESAENLKLYPSPPSSPDSASLFAVGSCFKTSPENTKENEKSYPCSFGDCHKVYAKPAHLRAHLRRHLGEKPYVCNWPDCTWRFSRSDELSRHRRSHSGVKPYKCDFCAKCFARSDHLTKHRKVHERRLQAARKAGKAVNGVLPASVLTVRPGRKRKNQI